MTMHVCVRLRVRIRTALYFFFFFYFFFYDLIVMLFFLFVLHSRTGKLTLLLLLLLLFYYYLVSSTTGRACSAQYNNAYIRMRVYAYCIYCIGRSARISRSRTRGTRARNVRAAASRRGNARSYYCTLYVRV